VDGSGHAGAKGKFSTLLTCFESNQQKCFWSQKTGILTNEIHTINPLARLSVSGLAVAKDMYKQSKRA
jgi:hypothetical protein